MIAALLLVAVRGILAGPDTGAVGQLCPVGPEIAYTVEHVVKGAMGGEWKASNGNTGRFRVVMTDSKNDIAIVKAENSRFPWWYPLRRDEPTPGEPTYVVGYGVWADNWYPSDPGPYLGVDSQGDFGMLTPVHFGMSGGCVWTHAADGVEEVAGVVVGLLPPERTGWPVAYGRPLWKRKKKEVQ